MNKTELSKILNDPLSKINLYNAVNLRFDDESQFNKQDYSRFIFRNFWHLFSFTNQKQAKELFEKMGSDGSFDNFYKKLFELNLYDKYYKRCENILKTDTEWANSRCGGTENIDGKIFLSVNNDQLYFLADELLNKIIQAKMQDYDFKVNCDENISRRDGIVIYFNKDNFKKYIEIVETIQKEHPEIRFNEPNCFAYKYNNAIGVGKDYKDGSSFTEKCCNIVGKLDLNNPENSLENIEKSVNKHLESVIDLCKSIKENEHSLDD